MWNRLSVSRRRTPAAKTLSSNIHHDILNTVFAHLHENVRKLYGVSLEGICMRRRWIEVFVCHVRMYHWRRTTGQVLLFKQYILPLFIVKSV